MVSSNQRGSKMASEGLEKPNAKTR